MFPFARRFPIQRSQLFPLFDLWRERFQLLLSALWKVRDRGFVKYDASKYRNLHHTMFLVAFYYIKGTLLCRSERVS